LGFFRPVREQIVYKSIYLPNQVSDPAKETAAVKKTIDPAARQPVTTDSQSIDYDLAAKGTTGQTSHRLNPA